MINRNTKKEEVYIPKDMNLEKTIKCFDALETYVTRIYTPNNIYIKTIENGVVIVKTITG